MTWTVYILQCRDGRLYTGSTTDPQRRLAEHRAGQGGRFTRAFGAGDILYTEDYPTRGEAVAREEQLKAWSRAKKLALVTGDLGALKRA